jgi:hypothetical protein
VLVTMEVETCLRRLEAHVDRSALAITGSVAMGGRSPKDLDFIAAHREVVASSVCRDFLVSHYHGGEKLIVQLVDPVTRIRVDIFPDRLGMLATARPRPDGWRVVEFAALLEYKLALLANATRTAPIDPKHAADVRMLAARLGRPEPAIDAAALRVAVYATDVTASCARCAAAVDPVFPLAAKSAIFDILGYV